MSTKESGDDGPPAFIGVLMAIMLIMLVWLLIAGCDSFPGMVFQPAGTICYD